MERSVIRDVIMYVLHALNLLCTHLFYSREKSVLIIIVNLL